MIASTQKLKKKNNQDNWKKKTFIQEHRNNVIFSIKYLGIANIFLKKIL
jgi:hypothetical protein